MPARFPQVLPPPRRTLSSYPYRISKGHHHAHTPPKHTTSNRSLHTSPVFRLPDHYATLGLAPSAPAPEVKKQFYKLSKAHHPDHNPSDPEAASKKFVAISEAYAVLGHPAKREKYDRERAPAGSGGGGGSYSSASGAYAAGSRRATGLSKRRAHFHGPPPSFYRSGGWGGASAKREANIGRDGREAEARRRRQQHHGDGSEGDGTRGSKGGSTSAWPFSTDVNDVAHFDREGHFRTQSSVEDQLKRGRMKRRGVVEQASLDLVNEADSLGSFLRVFAMLVVGIGVPYLFINSKGG